MFKSSPSRKSPNKQKTPDSATHGRRLSQAVKASASPPSKTQTDDHSIYLPPRTITPSKPSVAPVLPSFEFARSLSTLEELDANSSASSTRKMAIWHEALARKEIPHIAETDYTPNRKPTLMLGDSPPSVLSLPTREFTPTMGIAPEISARDKLRNLSAIELNLLKESGAESLSVSEIQRICVLRGVKFNGTEAKEVLLKRLWIVAETSEEAQRRILRAEQRSRRRKTAAASAGVEEWELQDTE